MPQKRIPLQPGYTYHIWTHANGDENLFRSEENYNYFLERYLHHVYPVVDTFAYCLMPNHLHLMVRVKNEEHLVEFLKKKNGAEGENLQGFKNLGGLVSQQFSNLFNAYTKAYNKKYNRKGSLFMPNFNRKLINSNQYFTQLIAYIHNNPIHHGFTKNLNDWPYSSWNAYVLDKLTNVSKAEAMQWFGTMENFKGIHSEMNFGKSITLFES
ncbi:hypothetical protein [Gracilimonas mengyeensis]|uniref:REP element-mobilizing transposase RayT n=1 Tax=Gracilimonas mengyeensis TaxID=1302730 RepID=A0A521CBZ7_9BACT|nr:hypothetical protein [Gracilimonas mengyeensis]SMO56928.1 REP element-mobilizing transposase RayT [Gracilimonas mengyeensis]